MSAASSTLLRETASVIASIGALGMLLLALPFVLAILVWAFPRVVAGLFAREDPKKLLKELLDSDETEESSAPLLSKSLSADIETSSISVHTTAAATSSAAASNEQKTMETNSVQCPDLEIVAGSEIADQPIIAEEKKAALSGIRKASSGLPTLSGTVPDAEDQGTWSRVSSRAEELAEGLRSRLNTATSSLEEALASQSKLESALEREKQKNTEFIRESHAQNQILKNRISALESEVAALKDLCESTSTEKAALEVNAEQAKINAQLASEQIATLVQRNTLLEESKSSLEDSLQESAKKVESLESSFKSDLQTQIHESTQALQSELTAIKKDLHVATAKCTSLESELAASNATMKESRDLVASIKQINTDLEEQVISLEKEKKTMDAHITALKTQAESMQSELDTLKSTGQESGNTDQELQSIVTAKASLQAELDIVKEQVSELSSKLSESEQALATASSASDATIASLQAQLDKLNDEKQSSDESEAVLAQLKKDLELANRKFKIQDVALNAKISSLRDDLAAVTEEKNQLATKLEQVQGDLADCRASSDQASRMADELLEVAN